MIKAVFLFILFFGLADTLLVSCCKDSPLDFTEFNSMRVANTDLKEELPDSATVGNDHFRINCQIFGEFIAIQRRLPLLSNTSYATSCENKGLLGLRSDVLRFKITCNEDILGVPAGNPLNLERIKACEVGFFDDEKNQRLSISQWLNIFNNGDREKANYNLYFDFEDELISNKYLRFRFSMEFQDGRKLEAETASVLIQ